MSRQSVRCPGFRFGAASGGIKRTGVLDVGIIVPDRPAAAAAVFTQNRVKAAPVRVSQAVLRRRSERIAAVVVNSGNANACTGDDGMRDARAMAAAAARALSVPRGDVVVASTGVIGVPLPMAAVDRGITAAAAGLRPAMNDFARAILTTDRAAKIAARKVRAGGAQISLIGCTKGAGMIAPNMATTLTFVATDAEVAPALLRRCLRRAADETYNAMSVDGDTSTNDMLLVLAGGAAQNRALSGGDVARFETALTELLDELARALMRGGEGVHHVVDVRVRNARSRAAARQVARAIANSPLVKTAIAGGDANWGRFVSAAGNSGVAFDPARVDLWLDRVQLVAGGTRASGANLETRAAAVMSRANYTVTLDLHSGAAEAHYLACDLSHEYVSINADYRS